jgi:hypothetical protein
MVAPLHVSYRFSTLPTMNEWPQEQTAATPRGFEGTFFMSDRASLVRRN